MHNEIIKSYCLTVLIYSILFDREQNGDYGRWEFGRSRKNFIATRYAILPGIN